jgi:hypothetical protein
MPTDDEIYCNCMEELKHRIAVIDSVLIGSTSTTYPMFDSELVYLLFRKSLELIAFSSLTANKVVYSAAYENFANHWNAKRLLEYLEDVNADFYPVAVNPPQTLANGTKSFSLVTEGFLTKDEFVCLYDQCGEILHARNPFATSRRPAKFSFSPKEWVARIQNLIRYHVMHLINGDKLVAVIPNEGKVYLIRATSLVNV